MHPDARTGRVELDRGDMERFTATADTFRAPTPAPLPCAAPALSQPGHPLYDFSSKVAEYS
jgi:hypothetical protein